ncbi:MAG: RpoL/Rpb11 RNA polymerase subunit family protein [Candidatus Aenigmatarchaeota archaeon]|nr:DNA-directed RNA polymerase subunit L [Candidatus Aenigmarchaeota archaeon]
MEVKAIKGDKDSIMVEIKGDTISFANLIAEELWEIKDVKEAAAIKEHPYLSEPRVYVKANDPKKALVTAAKEVQNKVKEIEKEFQMSSKK